MQKLKLTFILFFILILLSNLLAQSKIIDHNCTDISQIPESAIIKAKTELHIAYGHTSHGSQIITGMNNLDEFMGGTGLYSWHDGPENGSLDIDDGFMSGDLGNPDRTTWATRTREYLNNQNHNDVNVVMWSWCGQASSASEDDINTYLNLMNQLEIDFSNINFVYMTGHLDGSGLNGNLHLRNEQIRNYCRTNNKYLFDFADIECYDPDGNYYGDKNPNDACNYDSDENGSLDANWAINWQNTHPESVDWYQCSSAHSQPLNANQKAYAAWWLWSTISSWQGISNITTNYSVPFKITLMNNYPNPFNPSTTINYTISSTSSDFSNQVTLIVYNILGSSISTLVNQQQNSGNYKVIFDAGNLPSGIYYYTLTIGSFTQTRRMILMK
jgi:hypothetical protein